MLVCQVTARLTLFVMDMCVCVCVLCVGVCMCVCVCLSVVWVGSLCVTVLMILTTRSRFSVCSSANVMCGHVFVYIHILNIEYFQVTTYNIQCNQITA